MFFLKKFLKVVSDLDFEPKKCSFLKKRQSQSYFPDGHNSNKNFLII